MNATKTIDENFLEERKCADAKAVFGDFLGEGLVGVITVILTIIGLSGFSPEVMLSIATIVIGLAFLLEAGAVSTRFPTFLAEKRGEVFDRSFSVGAAAEFIGGITGIFLGVLSLIGLSRMVLASVAVIVYGFTLVVSSGTELRFNLFLRGEPTESNHRGNFAREAVSTVANFEFLLGLSVVILAIIALSGSFIAGTLNLTALLILGVSGFLTAAVVTARIGGVFKGCNTKT